MQQNLVTIVWGDSIVYGYNDNEFGGWVSRLKIILNKKSKNNFVFNLGIPGQNSTDILNRFESELKNRFNCEDSFKLVFSFGIKDTLLINKKKEYLKRFEKNLSKIIKKSLKFTDDICFVGLIKPDFKKRNEYNLDNILLVDTTIKKICKLNNIQYIEIKHIIKKRDLGDGLHPNNIGYEKIAREVFKKHYDN